MKKEHIKIIKELFNFNLKLNSLSHLNIIISIFFVSALNLTMLIFCVNSFLGKIILIISCLIMWTVGVGYGIISYCKQSKELDNYRDKIRKLLEIKNE